MTSQLEYAAQTWDPIRPQLIELAHMLHGTCWCGRPPGRPGRRHCCTLCGAGYDHGRLCDLRNGIPR